MTPFFQVSRRSLAYQFTIIAPLLCPPFSNFRKIFNFQPCFGQNFSSQDANKISIMSLSSGRYKYGNRRSIKLPVLWCSKLQYVLTLWTGILKYCIHIFTKYYDVKEQYYFTIKLTFKCWVRQTHWKEDFFPPGWNTEINWPQD